MTPIMRLLTLTRTFLYAVPRVADVCSYRDARVTEGKEPCKKSRKRLGP